MIDVQQVWDDVKARQRRADACQRHFFPHRPAGYKLGEKVTCSHCGVEFRLSDIGQYVRGFVAAGGSAAEVFPDWRKP